MNVVSNAGPLITLGKLGQLGLLLGLLLRLYAVEIYGSILSYVSWPSRRPAASPVKALHERPA
jgi:hypothetical protein